MCGLGVPSYLCPVLVFVDYLSQQTLLILGQFLARLREVAVQRETEASTDESLELVLKTSE